MLGKTRKFCDGVITVTETNEDFDFIGYIANETDEDIELSFVDEIESVTIPAGDWFGILAEKVEMLEALFNKRYLEVSNG